MSDTDLLIRRLAAIQSIVEQSEDIGKTKVQKIVYFLQEGLGVPLHYSFRMHHYGPFSQDIDSDISALQSVGYIEVNHDPYGYGYHIIPVSGRQLPWDQKLGKYRGEMIEAISALSVLDASDLELIATVHFVQHLIDDPSKEKVLDTVCRLKPKFTKGTIQSAYEQLVKNKLIVEAPSA